MAMLLMPVTVMVVVALPLSSLLSLLLLLLLLLLLHSCFKLDLLKSFRRAEANRSKLGRQIYFLSYIRVRRPLLLSLSLSSPVLCSLLSLPSIPYARG